MSAPVGFLAGLGAADRAALIAGLRTRKFDRGDLILREGEVPHDFAILLSGRVKLIARSSVGHAVLVALRGPGALLGELSAIDGKPRAADAVALEPVEAAVGPVALLRRFLAERPAAMQVVAQLLVERLREADRGRVELAAHDARGRVALRLLELAANYGRPEGGGVRVQVPITQDELADWTGMTRQSVARALSTLRADGFVSTHWMGLVIHRPDGLRAAIRSE